MTKFIINECGHIVTEKTFPRTLCNSKHLCGALFDPYGVSEDCRPAANSSKVCQECLAVQKAMEAQDVKS